MNRIWKPINLSPFNKSHLISNYGDIKVIKTGRLLKQRFDKDGYYQVNLYYNGLEVTKKVHRLVALTFLKDDYKEDLVVNHIDGVKTNNYVGNLEWVTISRNTQHAFDMGLESKGVDHCNAKHYILLDNENNLISQYENTFKLEECTGKSRGFLNEILKGNLLEVKDIDYSLPVNKQLNKSDERLFIPILLYDENYNIIGLYSNSQSLEKHTTISRRVIAKVGNDFYKYKKRGKQYKKIYYIKKINYIDFFIIECDNIDGKLVIE